MKILFVCHRIPYPPNKGEKLRAFNIVKYLSKNNDIYLVSLYDDKKDKQSFAGLREYCKEAKFFYLNPFWARARSLLCLFSGLPATLGYFYSRKMGAAVNMFMRREKFDLIFAYSSSTAQYVIHAEGKKIIDFVDCDSAKWRQYGKSSGMPFSLLYKRESVLLEKYEKSVVDNFDQSLVVSKAERNAFSSFADVNKIAVLVNGVDTDYFKPAQKNISKKIVFTGMMNYYINIDGVTYFSKEIFPLIRERVPGAEFCIVGRNPTRGVRALSGIGGISVTGFVDDVRPYFADAAICVVPLRISQGVQNKILEAMASGLPVVVTSKVLPGLEARSGEDLLAADGVKDFADKVVMLLEDAHLRNKIGENARRYVERYHNWEENLSVLDKIIKVGRDA